VQEIDDVWKERLAVRDLLAGITNFVAIWCDGQAPDLPERDPDEILELYKAKLRSQAHDARPPRPEVATPEEVQEQRDRKPKPYVDKLNVEDLVTRMIDYLKEHPLSKSGEIADGLGIPKPRIYAAMQRERRKLNPRIERWGTRSYYVVGHFDPVEAKVIEEVRDEEATGPTKSDRQDAGLGDRGGGSKVRRRGRTSGGGGGRRKLRRPHVKKPRDREELAEEFNRVLGG
jgi:hypothetical protein